MLKFLKKFLVAMGRKSAFEHVKNWARGNVASHDREAFREIVENELVTMHEGNCARYRVGLREFKAWQEVWNQRQS